MFSLQPYGAIESERLESLKQQCDSFQPYGLSYRAVFKGEGFVHPDFKKYFAITLVSPSLEDVFVQKIEGDKTC
jgi:hypothetical protein